MGKTDLEKLATDESLKSMRKFGRISVQCDAILSFPARQAHPRVKAQFIQIGKGGCALTTTERLFIGEECLVWATAGGRKFLGVSGKIVWMKTYYEGHETSLVGIEFKKTIELDAELLKRLGAKS